MTAEQAFEAVHITAPHLADEGISREIVSFVAAAQEEGSQIPGPHGGQDLAVEPALLSLVCHGLNERRKTQGKPAFDSALLKGTGQAIISDYYRHAVADLPERVQRFIEEELITERGFRKPCDIDDARAVHGVTDGDLRLLVDRRLLRIEPHRRTERIELTHDLLTRVVREHRDRHRESGKTRLQRRRRAALMIIGVVLAGLVIAFGLLYRGAEQQRWRAESERSRAERALTETGLAKEAAESSAAAERKQRAFAEGETRRAEHATQDAEAAQHNAERLTKIATSGRLATTARLKQGSQLDLSLRATHRPGYTAR